MLATNIAGANASAAVPVVGKVVVLGLGAGIGWGVLSVLAVVGVGAVFLCRKYADSIDAPVGDLGS
jgi:hypothetical protein